MKQLVRPDIYEKYCGPTEFNLSVEINVYNISPSIYTSVVLLGFLVYPIAISAFSEKRNHKCFCLIQG